MKYGFNPPETALDKETGHNVYIEPAVVTTHLSADDEGNITHETEFLDTPAGEAAERLFTSRQGGFSSAIFAKPHGGVDVPLVFGGFDYVFEPNFTTNRGYMLDSVDGGMGLDGMMLDAVLADWEASHVAHKALYDSLARDHEAALAVLARLEEENAELLSIATRAAMTKTDGGVIVLDSADSTRPLVVSRAGGEALTRRVNAFRRGSLTDWEPEKEDVPEDATLRAAKSHYGV
jgi:hypothetical protein